MALFAVASIQLRYLALGSLCIAAGVYTLARDESSPPAAARPLANARANRAAPAQLPVSRAPDLAISELADEDADDVVRGYESHDDPAEFAYVIEIDGVAYLHLPSDERATARGEARMIQEESTVTVVAPVETAAMPADLRVWAGREVVVGGACRASVVGFAEVSRASGEPPDADDGAEPVPPGWSIESLTEANVTLAARLDGCGGGGDWARAASYPAAAIAAPIDAPQLEAAALREVLAPSEDDELQVSWAEQGGDGDWRDAVEVVSNVYQHELTDERWVIVQARSGGGCGEPSVALMAVYRAQDDGTVRRVATLEYAYADVREVIDLDGDGQPELLVGDASSTSLIDLTGAHHASISVPEYSHTCGC